MPRKSVLDRYELFVAAAILGAHANTLNQGFRQYYVRFLIEIFTNWVDSAEENPTLPVQNTQVGRYLDSLVDEGFARKFLKDSHPLYRLTRTGLIELIGRVVDKPFYPKKIHFYFVFYFISSYRVRIIELVRAEGTRFPYALQAELESLLDPDVLIDRQMEYASRELKKLNKRIDEQKNTSVLVKSLLQQNKPFNEILLTVERRFPYALNTEKRYSEVFAMGTERQSIWELHQGNERRSEHIWMPSRRLLIQHIEELNRLREWFKKDQQELERKKTARR